MELTEKHKKLYELKKLEQIAEKYSINDASLQSKIDAEISKVKSVKVKLK